MLIEHEATGHVFEVFDQARIPGGYRRVEEAKRIAGSKPDPISDPIGWRQWWLACNSGKNWSDAGAAWLKAVE